MHDYIFIYIYMHKVQRCRKFHPCKCLDSKAWYPRGIRGIPFLSYFRSLIKDAKKNGPEKPTPKGKAKAKASSKKPKAKKAKEAKVPKKTPKGKMLKRRAAEEAGNGECAEPPAKPSRRRRKGA